MLHNTMLCTGASCKTPQIPSKFAQILRDLKILTPNGQDHIVLRCFYIQRCSCTGMLLHYTRVLWRRDAFHKDRFLQTDVCTYGCFCPGTKRCFYTQILPLCTGAFTRDAVTQSSFHTHTQMRRYFYTDAFTQRCMYTGMLLHTCAFTQGFLWHRVSFKDRSFNTHTQILLRGDVLAYRSIFIQRHFLHTDTFTKKCFSTDSFTQRCLCTQVLLD